MSFTYTTLQTEVLDWLNRADLAAKIPVFIALAEAQMQRRLRRTTVRTSLILTSESTSLPSDCAELRSISLRTASLSRDLPVRVGSPEQLAEARARSSSVGRPTVAAIIAGRLVVAPPPDTSYEADVTYFQQLTPLSATVATNPVLVEAPDAYLFGSLAQAAPYLQHDERITMWAGLFDAAIEELNAVREREELSASIRPLRLARSF